MCYRAMLKFNDKYVRYNKCDFDAIIKLSENTLSEI